ncbi:MAG: hypothetical protein IJL62_07455 [Clostridia bacterium]|nr:hypothetical protein [Clostridia bacterium]
MNILERYNQTLKTEAERQRSLAASASEKGDARMQSIHLMKASMLGDMLSVLGRVEHEGKRPNALETLIESFSDEADRLYKSGDFDGADRAEQKSITVQFALDALKEAEQHGA